MQKVIDAHHHLWQLDKNIDYPWLTDKILDDFFLGDYQSIRKSFLINDLLDLIPQNYQLIGSVHCEAEAHRSYALKEANWIDGLIKHQPVICAQSVWLDLSSPQIASHLNELKNINSVKGVRWKPVTAKNEKYISALAKKNTLLDKVWQPALSALAEQNLLWELRVPAWHLTQASECLENYPNLRVVLNHCGLPWDRTSLGIKKWQQGMALLAQNPNVVVKLSELGAPNIKRDIEQDKRLLSNIIEIFGSRRCLFASNMPVASIQVSYGQWLLMVDEVASATCPNDKDAIFWKNAMDCYGIDHSDLNKKSENIINLNNQSKKNIVN